MGLGLSGPMISDALELGMLSGTTDLFCLFNLPSSFFFCGGGGVKTGDFTEGLGIVILHELEILFSRSPSHVDKPLNGITIMELGEHGVTVSPVPSCGSSLFSLPVFPQVTGMSGHLPFKVIIQRDSTSCHEPPRAAAESG